MNITVSGKMDFTDVINLSILLSWEEYPGYQSDPVNKHIGSTVFESGGSNRAEGFTLSLEVQKKGRQADSP